jgi:hypothetical protein
MYMNVIGLFGKSGVVLRKMQHPISSCKNSQRSEYIEARKLRLQGML